MRFPINGWYGVSIDHLLSSKEVSSNRPGLHSIELFYGDCPMIQGGPMEILK